LFSRHASHPDSSPSRLDVLYRLAHAHTAAVANCNYSESSHCPSQPRLPIFHAASAHTNPRYIRCATYVNKDLLSRRLLESHCDDSAANTHLLSAAQHQNRSSQAPLAAMRRGSISLSKSPLLQHIDGIYKAERAKYQSRSAAIPSRQVTLVLPCRDGCWNATGAFRV